MLRPDDLALMQFMRLRASLNGVCVTHTLVHFVDLRLFRGGQQKIVDFVARRFDPILSCVQIGRSDWTMEADGPGSFSLTTA
jgi:hypothetical protein